MVSKSFSLYVWNLFSGNTHVHLWHKPHRAVLPPVAFQALSPGVPSEQ